MKKVILIFSFLVVSLVSGFIGYNLKKDSCEIKENKIVDMSGTYYDEKKSTIKELENKIDEYNKINYVYEGEELPKASSMIIDKNNKVTINNYYISYYTPDGKNFTYKLGNIYKTGYIKDNNIYLEEVKYFDGETEKINEKLIINILDDNKIEVTYGNEYGIYSK